MTGSLTRADFARVGVVVTWDLLFADVFRSPCVLQLCFDAAAIPRSPRIS